MKIDMQKFLDVLKAIKLFDPDNTLSLSNVAMMVVIVKMAIAPADWGVLTAFFLALANHNGKKWFNKKRVESAQKASEDMQKMQDEMQQIRSALALRD